MGKLVIVVGNSGVGKTTLTRLLCEQGRYQSGLEEIERPFQSMFAQDLQRYALSNQLDFLLHRTEQELLIRFDSDQNGILDGGMEQDFYIFTRHFLNKGYLSEPEFQLCERLVGKIRQLLPAPDLVIYLNAPLEKIAERYARRGRPLEITRQNDLGELQILLDEWLAAWPGWLIRVNASEDDPTYAGILPGLLDQMQKALI